MASDPLEDVLHLEDQFYNEGYQQGFADGVTAGKLEGRSFGMSKGFEKFSESGRLYGRALVWANRLPRTKLELPGAERTATGSSPPAVEETSKLPPLLSSAKLEKNIHSVIALVEPDTLSTANTDEAVDDFDDRLKRAQGKAKVVERVIGEAREAPKEAAGNSLKDAM